MHRRDLLKAVPAVLTAGASTAAAQGLALTPIAALFGEWQILHARMNGPDFDMPCDEQIFDEASTALSLLEAKIMHTPSSSPVDLLMKIASFTSWGGFEISDCRYASADIIWDEMRAMIGGAS